MKRQMSRIVMVMALLFTSTALTGCYFTARMMEIPKISDEGYQPEQTEAETREEGTEGAKEQEETEAPGEQEKSGTQEESRVRGIPKMQESNEQQDSQHQSAAPAAADPKRSETVSSAQKEQIRHIAEIYDRTIQDQGDYRQEGGRYYTAGGVLAKAVVSNGDPVLDEAMRKSGYKTYALEYFYEDWPQGDSYPIYIYAVIDENVYRYYFCQGAFIRRIGPEGGGNTNDAPKMNGFIQTLLDQGAAYRRQAG